MWRSEVKLTTTKSPLMKLLEVTLFPRIMVIFDCKSIQKCNIDNWLVFKNLILVFGLNRDYLEWQFNITFSWIKNQVIFRENLSVREKERERVLLFYIYCITNLQHTSLTCFYAKSNINPVIQSNRYLFICMSVTACVCV